MKTNEWISIDDEKPPVGKEFEGWLNVFGEEYGFWEPRCIINDDLSLGLWGRVDYDQDGWDYGLTHLTLTHWHYQPEPPGYR